MRTQTLTGPHVRGASFPLKVAGPALILLALIIVCLGWRALAPAQGPALSQIIDTLILLASLFVVLTWYRRLTRNDWLIALGAAALMGALVPLTGFYPLLAWLLGPSRAAPVGMAHGLGLAIALLAGLAIMRQGGPVRVRLARGEWRRAAAGVAFGVAIGAPLAALNAYANTLTQARPFVLQPFPFPLVEALEPGIVEESVYRFALLGLLWLALRPAWQTRAVPLAGACALLIHSYAHYGDLLRTQPLVYLAYGAALAVIWGVPLTVLAIRRDLESAVGFHWVQDAARFMGGL